MLRVAAKGKALGLIGLVSVNGSVFHWEAATPGCSEVTGSLASAAAPPRSSSTRPVRVHLRVDRGNKKKKQTFSDSVIAGDSEMSRFSL